MAGGQEVKGAAMTAPEGRSCTRRTSESASGHGHPKAIVYNSFFLLKMNQEMKKRTLVQETGLRGRSREVGTVYWSGQAGKHLTYY